MADQLGWARFHLGDGRTDRGARVLPAEVLEQMPQPTVALYGGSLGDERGAVVGVDLAGRRCNRVATASQ